MEEDCEVAKLLLDSGRVDVNAHIEADYYIGKGAMKGKKGYAIDNCFSDDMIRLLLSHGSALGKYGHHSRFQTIYSEFLGHKSALGTCLGPLGFAQETLDDIFDFVMPNYQLRPQPVYEGDAQAIQDQIVQIFMRERREKLSCSIAYNAQSRFVSTIKSLAWPDKKVIVEKILDYTFDMSWEEAKPLGEALAQLLAPGFIDRESFLAAVGEFCESYTAVESDVPRLNEYFAGLMAPVLRAKLLTVEELRQMLRKDENIDKNPRSFQPFGRLADFLAHLWRAHPMLKFSPADWGLDPETFNAWRNHYSKANYVRVHSLVKCW